MKYNAQRDEISYEMKRFKDMDTGEILTMPQIIKRIAENPEHFDHDSDKLWWRVFLTDFLNLFTIFEYKKIDVVAYILKKTYGFDNVFRGTQKEIEDKGIASRQIITNTFKKLEEHSLIYKLKNGEYQISEALMFQGYEDKRDFIIRIREDGYPDAKKYKSKKRQKEYEEYLKAESQGADVDAGTDEGELMKYVPED